MHADTDLDESGDEDKAQPFSLDAQRQAVTAEPWGITCTSDPSSSPHPTSCPASPLRSPQQHTSSTTQWQAHWLELRIHALRQQQQRYELRLQKLQQQQDPQAAALLLPPAHASADPQAEASFQDALQQAAGPIAVPHQQPSTSAASASQAVALDAQAVPLAVCEPGAVVGTSLLPGQTQGGHQQAPAVREPRYKHRHARHPVPGLSMPEMARHPFFCQHSVAGSGHTAEPPAAQGEVVCNLLCYTIVKHAAWIHLTKMLRKYFSGTVYMPRIKSIMNQVLLNLHCCFPWRHV